MFKKSIAAMAGLAAMAGGGAAQLMELAAAAKLQEERRRFAKPGKGGSKSKPGKSYAQCFRSKRYPEQSSRQALRGSRRAQGGPGLMFIPPTGWEPRQDGVVGEHPLHASW